MLDTNETRLRTDEKTAEVLEAVDLRRLARALEEMRGIIDQVIDIIDRMEDRP